MSQEDEPIEENEEVELPEPATHDEAEAQPVEEFDIQADVTQLYLNEIGQAALLTAEQEVALARRTRDGDFEARQKMIEHNLRLVVNIAKH